MNFSNFLYFTIYNIKLLSIEDTDIFSQFINAESEKPMHSGFQNTRFKGYKTILTQYMPKKRASRGRSKGGKGSSGSVHCSQCGALVPRDKAKKVTGRITLVEPMLAKELRASGAYIPMSTDVKFYCVSCAVHRGIVKVRSESDRRTASKLR
jgi:small subunit ribosomal protein S26e